MSRMPAPAKAFLTTKAQKITSVDLAPLVDDLGRDVGRIESLIAALTQYKEDVFANGVGNLEFYSSEWAYPHDSRHKTLVSWVFHDRFRPRKFKLTLHPNGEYSATGEERLRPGSVRLTKIEITDAMVDQLRSRISAGDAKKAQALLEEWRGLHG